MIDPVSLRLNGTTIRAELREALTDVSLSRTIEGASTLDLSVHDPDRSLVRSKILGERAALTLDGAVFELVAVRKAGSSVQVTFEDAVVADLRKKVGKGSPSAKGGTTTIDAFARRLVTAAPGARLVAFGGQRNLAPLAVGGTEQETYWDALQRTSGPERGWRCFVDRGVVYFGPDSWLLQRIPTVSIREHTEGIDNIDWDCDVGKKATRAVITANLGKWTSSPGAPINVVDQGLGSGLWLVEEINDSTRITGTITLVRQQPIIPEPKPEPRDDGQPSSLSASGAGGSIVAGPVSARGFSWPLSGVLTSGYGQRSGRLHAGVDIACAIGTPVRAAKAGTVTFAGEASGYGIAVYVDHGDAVTRYAHLSRTQVRRGQQVDRGEQIALSGNTGNSTGPHLHLEVRVGGGAVNPLPYLPSRR